MSPRFSPLELDLLERLRDNRETGVSFPSLAEDLQQSAEAIAAAVAALETHGYQFSKKVGRKYFSPPESRMRLSLRGVIGEDFELVPDSFFDIFTELFQFGIGIGIVTFRTFVVYGNQVFREPSGFRMFFE